METKHFGRGRTARALGIACAVMALAAGCGGDDDDGPATPPPTSGGGGGDGGGGQTPAARPEITLTINAREDFPGNFGSVGQYERVTGSVAGEIDPKDPRNAVIQDLELAPVNARGLVEYKTEFVMLKPKDMGKAGGILRYDAPNRGNILTMPNPAQVPGDAVYFERGYVFLFAAWQGDVPKSSPARLTLTVPVARNKDGSSITGPYATELIPNAPTSTMSLPGGVFNGSMIPYEPASLDNTQAGYSLTRRVNETDPRIAIAPSDWKFADCGDTGAPFPGRPDGTKVCLKGGFVPGLLYELTYVAKDPKVMGVGLAALRDTVTFFRKDAVDRAGTPNPIAGAIRHAIGQGTSQSGNAMKTFLHLGFNASLAGDKVFDGIFAHVAARQTNINTRFAVPGGGGGLRTDHRAFGQTAPRGLAADYRDDVTGRTGGVMKRCTETQTCPRFFLGLSGTEFWQLQGSPVLTDAYGFRDIEQPPNARVYYYGSTQHGGKSAQINYNPASTVYPAGSMIDFADTFRALFVALEDWVARDVAPPQSQVPRLADGTLVRPDQLAVPVIRGVTWEGTGGPVRIPDFQYLARYNGFPLLDFGPQYRPEDESGIPTQLPPSYMGRDYAILVPQLDPVTGLSRSGIQSLDVLVPVGTSLEFNYVATPGIVDLVNLTGSYIPFHRTEAARIAAGDQRPSLESLYGTQSVYLDRLRTAATSLVAQRFLLPADADRAIARAQANPILP